MVPARPGAGDGEGRVASSTAYAATVVGGRGNGIHYLPTSGDDLGAMPDPSAVADLHLPVFEPTEGASVVVPTAEAETGGGPTPSKGPGTTKGSGSQGLAATPQSFLICRRPNVDHAQEWGIGSDPLLGRLPVLR